MDWDGVKNLIHERFDSIEAFADEVGIKYNTMIGWMQKGRTPKIHEALAIAQELGISVEYLVTGVVPDQKITKYENGQMKNDYMVKDIRGEYVPIDGEITFIPIHSQKVAAGAGQVLPRGGP